MVWRKIECWRKICSVPSSVAHLPKWLGQVTNLFNLFWKMGIILHGWRQGDDEISVLFFCTFYQALCLAFSNWFIWFRSDLLCLQCRHPDSLPFQLASTFPWFWELLALVLSVFWAFLYMLFLCGFNFRQLIVHRTLASVVMCWCMLRTSVLSNERCPEMQRSEFIPL